MRLNLENRVGIQPERTCIGCSKKSSKKDLLRLALDREDRVVWDLENRMPGRGAYLCPHDECLAAAIKRGRFTRAFRKKVDIDPIKKAAPPWKNQ